MRCPVCSTENREDVSRCFTCGHEFNSVQPKTVVSTPVTTVQSSKNKVTAGILAILLGNVGVHKFYLGQSGMGILYLVFCWTFVPAIIGIIEGITYLTMSDQAFAEKYH